MRPQLHSARHIPDATAWPPKFGEVAAKPVAAASGRRGEPARPKSGWRASLQPPVPFLLFVACVFAGSMTVGTREVGAYGPMIGSIIVILASLWVYSLRRFWFSSLQRFVPFVAAVVPAMALNVTISEAPGESTFKWLAWLAILLASYDIARGTPSRSWEAVLSVAPALFAIGALGLAGFGYAVDSIYGTMHMAATYFSYVLAFGVFAVRLPWKVIWVVVGLVGIYASGTRGALLSLPIALLVYTGYLFLSRRTKDAMGVALLVVAMGMFLLNDNIRESFLSRKQRTFESGLDSAMAGFEQRRYLAEQGLELARERPLGWGAGNTYAISVGNKRLGAHNGYIDTLVQLGYPTTIAIFAGFAWLCWRFLRNPALSLRAKGVFVSVLAILAARAGSESYSVFDTASFHIFFVWYVVFYGAFFARLPAKRPSAARRRPDRGMPERSLRRLTA